MADNNFYTGTDTKLYIGGRSFSDKINATPAAFGLSAAQAAAFENAYQTYAEAYKAVTDPALRTLGRTAAKNDARAILRKMSSDYARIVNGTSAVNDQQKIDLGLNVRKKPSRQAAPDTWPVLSIVSVEGRQVVVALRNADMTKRGRPATAMYANVYTYVAANGETAPTDATRWQFDGPATKPNYTIIVPNSVAPGTVLSVTAVWVSRRGEMSPIAAPVTTHVQFGPAAPSQGRMRFAA